MRCADGSVGGVGTFIKNQNACLAIHFRNRGKWRGGHPTTIALKTTYKIV